MDDLLTYLSAQSASRWELFSFVLLAVILVAVIFVGLNGLEQAEMARAV